MLITRICKLNVCILDHKKSDGISTGCNLSDVHVIKYHCGAQWSVDREIDWGSLKGLLVLASPPAESLCCVFEQGTLSAA